jgi:hypothetical protein
MYPPDPRADLASARATDVNPASNPALLTHLDEAAATFVRNARALFGVDLVLDGSDASVHRLSAALTPARRDAWASLGGAAGTAANALFNAVIHGAAYLGRCIVVNHHGGDAHDHGVHAAWSVRRPLWESVVRLRSRAGSGDLAVFHWWLKSLADDDQRTTLADRYRAHVEIPCARPEELPVISTPHALPRLKSPRYGSLHQYLCAHAPALRDLGADFPAPERFEEFALRWLDFHLVGGGRMLLLAGSSAQGLHLFWLTLAGFEKSAFLPCDAVPGPVVRVEGERVVAMTSQGGVARVHEMLWWGP